MTQVVQRVLRADTPGPSLAIWLAVHHPDIFVAAARQAKQAQAAKKVKLGWLKGLGRLSQDELDLTDVGTDAATSPDLISVSYDDSATTLPDSLLTPDSSIVNAINDANTSTGNTIGQSLASAGSTVLGALGSVASWATSSQGASQLLGLGTAIINSQAANTAAQAAAQTQQQVLAAQIARATTNQPVAPITYTMNSAGQIVPVYATPTPQGTVYQQLTPNGIAALTPSSLTQFVSQYGVWLLVGGAALFAVEMS